MMSAYAPQVFVNTHSNQQGVGLIEVLISLLILAMTALGLAGLQAKGLQLTNEAVDRSNGQYVVSELLQRMRTNAWIPVSDYEAAITSNSTTSPVCTKIGDVCSFTFWDQAQLDVQEIKSMAANYGMQLSAVTCGTSTTPLVCFMVAWGETTPTLGSATNDCFNASGNYNFKATCYRSEGLRRASVLQ